MRAACLPANCSLCARRSANRHIACGREVSASGYSLFAFNKFLFDAPSSASTTSRCQFLIGFSSTPSFPDPTRPASIFVHQALARQQGSSTTEAALRLRHCEEPVRFFDLRNLGPRVEANEGRSEQFAGELIPTDRLVELCK